MILFFLTLHQNTYTTYQDLTHRNCIISCISTLYKLCDNYIVFNQHDVFIQRSLRNKCYDESEKTCQDTHITCGTYNYNHS